MRLAMRRRFKWRSESDTKVAWQDAEVELGAGAFWGTAPRAHLVGCSGLRWGWGHGSNNWIHCRCRQYKTDPLAAERAEEDRTCPYLHTPSGRLRTVNLIPVMGKSQWRALKAGARREAPPMSSCQHYDDRMKRMRPAALEREPCP